MFERKITIVFAITGIVSVLGFICGVAPGILLSSYALLGIASGLLLLIVIFLIITIFVFERLETDQNSSTHRLSNGFYNKRLTRKERILFTFTNFLLLTAGVLLGVLCELLLKAISASFATQLIIAAIFIFVLLILLGVILILELVNSRSSKLDNNEQIPVPLEPDTHSHVLTKPQDGPQNTATRNNRYRSRNFDDDSKYTRANSSVTDSTNTFITRKPPTTIQTEYQKLLHPTPHFHLNDKVYVNDTDIARVIEVDGLGFYKIQYLDNNQTEMKSGAELRRALPLIT